MRPIAASLAASRYHRPKVALHLAVLLLLAAALLVSCGSGGSPTEPRTLRVSDVEGLSFDLVNAARAESGQNELAFDDELAKVARTHSRAMRDEGFFGHKDPSGNGLRKRLNENGVAFSSAGENLAQVNHGSNPAAVAHQQLMSSPEHRDIILTGKFTKVGVGVARSGDTFWFTQVFVKP